jgi:hypothetical protein
MRRKKASKIDSVFIEAIAVVFDSISSLFNSAVKHPITTYSMCSPGRWHHNISCCYLLPGVLLLPRVA